MTSAALLLWSDKKKSVTIVWLRMRVKPSTVLCSHFRNQLGRHWSKRERMALFQKIRSAAVSRCCYSRCSQRRKTGKWKRRMVMQIHTIGRAAVVAAAAAAATATTRTATTKTTQQHNNNNNTIIIIIITTIIAVTITMIIRGKRRNSNRNSNSRNGSRLQWLKHYCCTYYDCYHYCLLSCLSNNCWLTSITTMVIMATIAYCLGVGHSEGVPQK